MKWEYMRTYQHERLNDLGREGWELVAVTMSQDRQYPSVYDTIHYLKRQLTEPATDTGNNADRT